MQTEDSGVAKAHIYTHVFYDGTIIGSKKVEYRERLGESPLDPVVIGLMQDSHKSMIKALRRGEFDDKIVRIIGEHPVDDNRPSSEVVVQPEPAAPREQRERRAPPSPREVEPLGPPIQPGSPGPTTDPTISHPIFASAEAQATVASNAAGDGPQRPSRGPSRIRRRTIGGIGGRGVSPNTPVPLTYRRDIIVGKFASEHQAQLDDDILSLLRED